MIRYFGDEYIGSTITGRTTSCRTTNWLYLQVVERQMLFGKLSIQPLVVRQPLVRFAILNPLHYINTRTAWNFQRKVSQQKQAQYDIRKFSFPQLSNFPTTGGVLNVSRSHVTFWFPIISVKLFIVWFLLGSVWENLLSYCPRCALVSMWLVVDWTSFCADTRKYWPRRESNTKCPVSGASAWTVRPLGCWNGFAYRALDLRATVWSTVEIPISEQLRF